MWAVQDGIFAFRMGNELGLGMVLEKPDQFSLAERLVNDAAALPQGHLAADLLLEVAAEILVGRKKDFLVVRNGPHDLFRVGRRADVVALVLHRGRAVDVRDRDGPRGTSSA